MQYNGYYYSQCVQWYYNININNVSIRNNNNVMSNINV